MQTVTIPEQEYLQLKTAVADLQKTIQALQAQMQAFMALMSEKNGKAVEKSRKDLLVKQRIPLKRGAGKHLVHYIADDFTAPIDDLKEYME